MIPPEFELDDLHLLFFYPVETAVNNTYRNANISKEILLKNTVMVCPPLSYDGEKEACHDYF